MKSKMPRELEECDILLAHVVDDPDCALRIAGQAKEFPARAAQFALQRLNAGRWNMEALLEKCFNDVHECERWSHKDTIDLSGRRVTGVFVRPRRASECERPSGPACIVPPRLFRHHRSTRF
jgi:hypothetical protein